MGLRTRRVARRRDDRDNDDDDDATTTTTGEVGPRAPPPAPVEPSREDAKTIAAAMKPYGVAPFTWTVEQEQIIAQGKATHAQCVILGAFVPIKDASPRSLAVAQAYRNCTGTGGKFDSLHDLIRKKIAPMVQ
eukprot:4504728-Pyramimonas_sp.AAC.1